MADRTMLTLAEGSWQFLHGSWTGGPDGAFAPPDGSDVEYMAVKEDTAYGDFDATCRVKLRNTGGGARLLFRVQDAGRYYALDIPVNGQQFRARHFWAGLLVADGTPLQRYLAFGLVPGLCVRLDHWYDIRVSAHGPRLRAWINDIPVADVEDATHARGRIGLASIGSPWLDQMHFSGLTIDAAPAPPAPWPGLAAAEPHWITPCPEPEPGTFQSYAQLLDGGHGELVLFLTFGNPNRGETRRAAYLRSHDAGRTWGPPEPPALQRGFGASFVRADGTWVCVFAHDPITKAVLYVYESPDQGRTWDGPTDLAFPGPWPAGWRVGSPLRPVRMHDEALVMPVIVRLPDGAPVTARPPYSTCFAMRSDDDGRTWSPPVLADAQPRPNLGPLAPVPGGGLDLAARFFELGIDEVADDVLIGIGRPERDPYMWQIQSNDGGRSWEPAALGHFPGYCPSLTRTRDGHLIATTRFPYFAARLSRDRGRTWDPPVIVDYASWANQQATEAEPNVVVVTYMGHIMQVGQADSRIVRLCVRDDRLALDH